MKEQRARRQDGSGTVWDGFVIDWASELLVESGSGSTEFNDTGGNGFAIGDNLFLV